MKTSRACIRLLVTLALGLSLTVALLWLLGSARIPAARAGPLTRFLLAPLPASTNPISNALNVPITSNVSITFDEPISLTSVTTCTFAVRGSQSPIFTGTYSLSNLSRTVTLDPVRVFFPGERIDATVTTATLNITGEQAISSTVWQFWAAVGPGSGAFVGHPFPTTPDGSTPDSRGVALGDVDGDGDLDAVVATASPARSRDVYLNDGTGWFVTHPISPGFGVGYCYEVALGDVDSDGDLDAVSAEWSSTEVHLNDGTGVFTPHPISPTFGGGNNYAVALGDVDGDGDLDAVFASANSQPQSVYLNDGTGQFTAHPISPTFGAGDSFDVVLGDVDSDGDLDAVVANDDGTAQDVYLNDGTGQFTAHPISPTFGAGESHGVALGDLDGDGDLDTVVANYGQPEGVYLNDGTGRFSPHPTSPTFGDGWSCDVALGDIDGDGDLDAIVTNASPQPHNVYLNDGTGAFTPHPTSTTEGGGSSWGLALGDVDGDNDLDAIVTNSGAGSAHMAWLNCELVYLPLILRSAP